MPWPQPSSDPGDTSIVQGVDVKDLSGDDTPVDLGEIRGVAEALEPGDLGKLQTLKLTRELMRRSLRTNSTQHLVRPYNHRYRGEREAFKFNLLLQQVFTFSALVFSQLWPHEQALKAKEFATGPTTSDTPNNSEIALVYHINAQIAFKEWLLMRDADINWFTP